MLKLHFENSQSTKLDLLKIASEKLHPIKVQPSNSFEEILLSEKSSPSNVFDQYSFSSPILTLYPRDSMKHNAAISGLK
jgi:hypothetical protein